MRGCFDDRISKFGRDPPLPERAFAKLNGAGQISRPWQNARSFRLFVGAKLRARASDGRWTGLFISKLIDFWLKLLR